MYCQRTQNPDNMKTLEKIALHAQSLIDRGAPFTKDELFIINLAIPKGKAFNAGKRNDKHFQQTGK